MQPSLQTTPAMNTSPPSTSQESVCNDYDVCQHQEISKEVLVKSFTKRKCRGNFLMQWRLYPRVKSFTSWQFPKINLQRRHYPFSTLVVAIIVFVLSGCHSTPGWCVVVYALMVFSVQLVLFSVPMHQKATLSTNYFESGTKKARKLKNTNTLHIIRRPWSKLTILNKLLNTHM